MKGLAACAKRPAEEESADPHPSPPISKLGDDLLEEILIRCLRDPRSAVQSKIVSKRWCSVISNPYFFRRCIQFLRAPAAEDPIQPCPAAVRISITSFFPVYDMIPLRDVSQARRRFQVFNCAEGDSLFLCGFHDNFLDTDELSRSFFVCDRHTQRWVDLPLAPEVARDMSPYAILPPTLVCEPCNSVDLDLGDGESAVYSEYRFRVLRMHHLYAENNGEARLDVYCSESPGKWTSHVVGARVKRLFPKYAQGIRVLKGKLYWMQQSGKGVVEFNPFRLDQTPRVFDASSIFPEGIPEPIPEGLNVSLKGGVWVSQGHLHIVRLVSTSLSVWRWQGGGSEEGSLTPGLWTKLYEVAMDTLRWCSNNQKAYEDSMMLHLSRDCPEILFGQLCDKCDGGKIDPETEFSLDTIIGLHPDDPLVIYFDFFRPITPRRRRYACLDNHCGVVCNMHTRTLEPFVGIYQLHSRLRWEVLFRKPSLSSSCYWPPQIRNFDKLGGMYNGHYLSINGVSPPATDHQVCRKKKKNKPNFDKLGDMYNGHYLSINGIPPPATDQDCPKKNKRMKKSNHINCVISPVASCNDKASSSRVEQ